MRFVRGQSKQNLIFTYGILIQVGNPIDSLSDEELYRHHPSHPSHCTIRTTEVDMEELTRIRIVN